MELLESGMALNEETTHDFLKRIKKEAMRMTSLVDDILMISRLESRGAKTEIVTIQVADSAGGDGFLPGHPGGGTWRCDS